MHNRRPARLTAIALSILTIFPIALHAQQNNPAPPEAAPAFEVAAVKPSRPDATGQNWDGEANRIEIQNYTLRQLIQSAWNLKSESQIEAPAEWISKQHFDISAKIDDDEAARQKKLSPEERRRQERLMLQSLLTERFQLKVKPDTRTLPIYALVLNGPSSKLSAPQPSQDKIAGASGNHSMHTSNGNMRATSISMETFATGLTRMPEAGNLVVLDRTGLTGDYNFELHWTPDRGTSVAADAEYPGLFTALREQLGLKLERQTAPIPIVIVESATQPTLD